MNLNGAEHDTDAAKGNSFLANRPSVDIIHSNKTRQGYAHKRTLKPAGYFFLRGAK